MKVLFHLLLALLPATVTFAAPARYPQQPLTDKHASTTSASPSKPQPHPHAHARAPPPTASRHRVHHPYVVPAPASAHRKHRFGVPSLPSWLKVWEGPAWSTWSKPASASSADPTCFCAGGAVCCHTVTGLDCNAGYCGM